MTFTISFPAPSIGTVARQIDTQQAVVSSWKLAYERAESGRCQHQYRVEVPRRCSDAQIRDLLRAMRGNHVLTTLREGRDFRWASATHICFRRLSDAALYRLFFLDGDAEVSR